MTLIEKSIANIRVGVLNWPGERIPSSNVMNRQNRTERSSKINFLGDIQSEHWRTEIHEGKTKVLDIGYWP